MIDCILSYLITNRWTFWNHNVYRKTFTVIFWVTRTVTTDISQAKFINHLFFEFNCLRSKTFIWSWSCCWRSWSCRINNWCWCTILWCWSNRSNFWFCWNFYDWSWFSYWSRWGFLNNWCFYRSRYFSWRCSRLRRCFFNNWCWGFLCYWSCWCRCFSWRFWSWQAFWYLLCHCCYNCRCLREFYSLVAFICYWFCQITHCNSLVVYFDLVVCQISRSCHSCISIACCRSLDFYTCHLVLIIDSCCQDSSWENQINVANLVQVCQNSYVNIQSFRNRA